jgi:glutathione S-transferase
MSAIKLHVIKPSVNNMTARVFVRAAKLDFTEDDVYGKTRTDDFLAKNPAHLTPMMEAPGLPKGVMWESCAIMQYLSNKHHLDKFYPTDPEKRAMVDSAMFYIVGTLYPYIVRSTYGALGFPQYAGEVGASDADAAEKAKAQKAAVASGRRDARRAPQVLPRGQNLHRRRPSLDRRHPPRGEPRIPQGHRLPFSGLGEDLYGRHRQGARRRLRRASEGRRGVHRLCEGARRGRGRPSSARRNELESAHRTDRRRGAPPKGRYPRSPP